MKEAIGCPFVEILGVVADVPVDEVGGAHQAVRAHSRLVREVVEHQDALAEAVGSHLEAGAIGGERIVAAEPVPAVVGRRLVGVVLAVVEDDLEQPVGFRRARSSPALAGGCGCRT